MNKLKDNEPLLLKYGFAKQKSGAMKLTVDYRVSFTLENNTFHICIDNVCTALPGITTIEKVQELYLLVRDEPLKPTGTV